MAIDTLSGKHFLYEAKELLNLLDLEEDWDSYDGQPPDELTIWAALKFLVNVDEDTTPPYVRALGNGGVQLEWHRYHMSLEIEFLPHGGLNGFYEIYDTKETWEGNDPDIIQEALEKLKEDT